MVNESSDAHQQLPKTCFTVSEQNQQFDLQKTIVERWQEQQKIEARQQAVERVEAAKKQVSQLNFWRRSFAELVSRFVFILSNQNFDHPKIYVLSMFFTVCFKI